MKNFALIGIMGVDEASPKKIVKAYDVGGAVAESDDALFLAPIEDRNRLSHIDDSDTFNPILARLPDSAALFERVSAQLNSATR